MNEPFVTDDGLVEEVGLSYPEVNKRVEHRSAEEIKVERDFKQWDWGRRKAEKLGLDPDSITEPDTWDDKNSYQNNPNDKFKEE